MGAQRVFSIHGVGTGREVDQQLVERSGAGKSLRVLYNGGWLIVGFDVPFINCIVATGDGMADAFSFAGAVFIGRGNHFSDRSPG